MELDGLALLTEADPEALDEALLGLPDAAGPADADPDALGALGFWTC